MRIVDVMALLVALCRFLEVPPEELARFFREGDRNNAYYNILQAEVQHLAGNEDN